MNKHQLWILFSSGKINFCVIDWNQTKISIYVCLHNYFLILQVYTTYTVYLCPTTSWTISMLTCWTTALSWSDSTSTTTTSSCSQTTSLLFQDTWPHFTFLTINWEKFRPQYRVKYYKISTLVFSNGIKLAKLYPNLCWSLLASCHQTLLCPRNQKKLWSGI